MVRFFWILMVSGVALTAHADSALPYVFEEGTPARAEEVNANFSYLAGRIDNAEKDDSSRVIYVDAVPFAARATENGEALLQAMERTQGAGSNNRYQIVLRPGIYDLGEATLRIPTYTSVIGADAKVTTLRSAAATAITMAAGTRLESVDIHHHPTDAAHTIVLSPDPLGGATHLRDVRIQGTAQGDWTAVLATETVTLFLRDVRISIIGEGEVVGLESSGTGFVDAVDLMSRVRNDSEAGQTHGLLLSSRGSSRFISSQLQTTGGSEAIPLRTGENFNGTAHFIASRFVTDGGLFASVAGIAGKVFIGSSEVASGYYELTGSATIRCAQSFDRDYEDLSECFDAPR